MSKILIVDDNEGSRQLLSKSLSPAGYEIIQAENGEQGLNVFREQRPDLIITDMNMPVMDGFHLAEAISREPDSAHVPIIFVSALYKDTESKIRAMNIGGNEYLTHPVDREELLYKVRAMLRHKHLYDELLRSREAMKESEQKYRTLFNNATDAIYLIDTQTQYILDCNPKASEITGYSATELKTMCIGDLHPPSEQDIVTKIFRKMKKAGPFSDISGIHQLRKDGTTVPIEINATTFAMGDRTYSLGIFRDITERKKAEASLLHEKNRFLSILDAMIDGVYIVNKSYDIEYVNPVLKKEYSAAIGHKCYEYFHRNKKVCPMCKNEEIFAGNSVRWEWTSSTNKKVYDIIETPITDRHGNVSKLAILRDITLRKKMEEKLREAAVTDDLTGLFNRRGFITISEKHLNLVKRQKKKAALLFLDLDNMKQINDRMGHKEGDQALKDTAELLKKTFRKSDIIARMGGDEFGVFLTEITGGTEMVIHHLRANIDAMNRQKERAYPLSVSIGAACYDPAMPVSIDKLLSLADTMMYREKKFRKFEDHSVSEVPAVKTEKRSYRRFAPDRTWSVLFNGSGTAGIKDISRGGACLTSARRIVPNSIHELTVRSPSSTELTSSAMVVWTSRTKGVPGKNNHSQHYESGLKFIGQNAAASKALDILLAEIAG